MNFLLFEHNIRMAYEFGLLTKTLFLAEGIALELDPDFDYNVAARPVIDEVRQRYYSLHTLLEETRRELRGLRRQVVDLPRRLNNVLSYLEQGVVHVQSTDDMYEAKQTNLILLVNRAIIAALTIALLIASSVLLAAHPKGWIAHTAVIVLIADSILILLILLSLFKSRRF